MSVLVYQERWIGLVRRIRRALDRSIPSTVTIDDYDEGRNVLIGTESAPRTLPHAVTIPCDDQTILNSEAVDIRGRRFRVTLVVEELTEGEE